MKMKLSLDAKVTVNDSVDVEPQKKPSVRPLPLKLEEEPTTDVGVRDTVPLAANG